MDTKQAADLVERLIAEHGQLTGSRLSLHLRTHEAEWSPKAHGASTLAEFLEKSVPAVTVVRRSGLDPVYGLAAQPADAAPEDFWRIWSNPNSTSTLEIHSDSGEIRVVAKRAPAEPNWIRLTAPDAEKHRQIARDFIGFQFPAGEASLAAEITQDPAWWQGWFKQIKKLKLARSWTDFKRTRLLAAYEAAQPAGLADAAAKRAMSTMRRLAIPGGDLQQVLTQRSDAATVTELRRIAMLTIEEMSEEDLSKLRLPLGLVLRAIRRNG